MRSNTSKILLKGSLRQRAANDWLWGGLGMTAAAVSTTFGLYMLTFGPAERYLHGTPDFGLFAHLGPRTRVAPGAEASPADGSTQMARNGDTGRPESTPSTIDGTPTGSLTASPARDKGPASINKAAFSQNAPALPSFILRDVFDGKALIESRSALSLVAPGSFLDGAGEVLSIERRKDRWVVTTAHGVISGELP